MTDKNIKSVKLTIFGGEPLLVVDDVITFLTHINKICKNYNVILDALVTTNGLFDDIDKMIILNSLGVNRLQITFDGNEEINNIRRKSYSTNVYKKALLNLGKYIKYFNITIKYNFDNKNVMCFSEFLSDLNELNIDKNKYSVRIEAIQDTIQKYANYIEGNTIELSRAYFNLSKILKKYKIQYTTAIFSTPCMVDSENSFMIDPNGNISSCISAFEIEHFLIGKINEISSLEFDKSRFDRTSYVLSNCAQKNCPYIPICYTGCQYESYNNGNPNEIICKKVFYDNYFSEYFKYVKEV